MALTTYLVSSISNSFKKGNKKYFSYVDLVTGIINVKVFPNIG